MNGTTSGSTARASSGVRPRNRNRTKAMLTARPSAVATVAEPTPTTRLLRAASSRAASVNTSPYQSTVRSCSGKFRTALPLNEKTNRRPIGK